MRHYRPRVRSANASALPLSVGARFRLLRQEQVRLQNEARNSAQDVERMKHELEVAHERDVV